MRKGFLAALCISPILFSAGVFARPHDSSPAAVQEKERAKPVVITAIVSVYEADKTLQLDVKGKPRTYDLSQTEVTYKIDPNIRIGGTVEVTDQTDAMGHQTITVTAVKGSD
jgi:hypothetical protein